MKRSAPLLLVFLLGAASASVELSTAGNDTVSGYNVTEWFHFLFTNDGPAGVYSVNITIPEAYQVVDVDGPNMWTTETNQRYAWFNTTYPLEEGDSDFFNISAHSMIDGNHTWAFFAGNETYRLYSQVSSTPPEILFASIYPIRALVTDPDGVSDVLARWENDTTGNWTPMAYESGFYTVDLPPLKEGVYTLRVFANDTLGNAAYGDHDYYEDHTRPIVTLTSPSETTYTSEEITVSYLVYDRVSPNVYCFYKLDMLQIPSGYLETNVTYSHKVIVSGEGSHVIYMNCTDLGGNSGQNVPIVFNVDLPEDYQSPPVVYYPIEKEEETDDFWVQSSAVSLQLEPGQNRTFSLQVYSNRDWNLTLAVNSTLFIEPFLLLPEKVAMDSLSVETLPVWVSIPENATRGFYTGEIRVSSNATAKSVPILIEVVREVSVLLYSIADIYDPEPRAGDQLRVHVKVFSLGEAPPGEVIVDYTIRPKDNNTAVFSRSEQHVIGESVSYETYLPLAGLDPGYYILQLSVSYGNYTDSSFSAFEVLYVSFWDTEIFGLKLGEIVIAASVMVISAIIIWRALLRARSSLRKRKEERSKYKQTLSELPKGGEGTIFLGKVAETKQNAYININELMKHTLICGGTGAGKTVAAMVIAEEALMNNVSVTVFDPTLQWTGFAKENKDSAMLSLYPEFGIKQSRTFQVDIRSVSDPKEALEIPFEKGKMCIVALNKLDSKSLDSFLDVTLKALFDRQWQEAGKIEHLIVFDEVHRLLPRYGGAGKAIPMVERAIREFRKWGVGVVLISQVLTDFKAAVRANVENEIQMRTEFDGDIRRIKSKYGAAFSKNITKLTVGTGMIQNPEYNKGVPYFIVFRPIVHEPKGLSPQEVDRAVGYRKKLEELENRMRTLERQGIDVYQPKVELDLAKANLTKQQFSMVEAYITSIEKKLGEQ